MFATYSLWEALREPFTRHPIFYRALQLRKSGIGQVSFFVQPTRRLFQRVSRVANRNIFTRILFLAAALPLAAFLIPVILYAGIPLLMFGLPIALPLIINAHGLSWAVGIGTLIANECERKTFDLVCVTPYGPMSTVWAIASGYIHFDKTLGKVAQLRAWQLAIIWVVVPFVSSMAILQFGQIGYVVTHIPVFVAYLAAFTAMLYIDQFQSIIMGVLVAISIAPMGRAMQETRMLITGAYMLLQFAVYLSALLICLGLLPIVFSWLNIHSTLVDFGLPMLSVVLFFIIHELLIRWLWSSLRKRIGAETIWHERAYINTGTELDQHLSGGL
ncbi:MAG: hypothetical protein U0694_11820 [Anaerolineae bacterium]